MTAIDLVTLLTALVAVYGAALSTYSFVAKRRENRRRVKVELSPGILGTLPQATHALLISASNPGNRPVTLVSVSFDLPDKRQVVLFKPGGDVQLPHELTEGKGCTFWGDPRGLASELKRKGFSGTVRLVGVVRDAVGTRHLSKPLNFRIEEWS